MVVATRARAPFAAIWLETSPHLLEERASRRRLNPADATPEVARMQPAYDLGPLAWPNLDSSESEADTLAACAALGINPA